MFFSKHIQRLFFRNAKQSFLFLALFVVLHSYAQKFEKVDAITSSYSSGISDAKVLATHISDDFKDQTNQVRALFIWLTHHIDYNINELNYGATNYSFRYSSKEELEQKIRARDLEIIHKTLQEKRAVCEGYSMVFKEVCDILNIRCEIISGYSRSPFSQIGKLPLSGKHAWNAVYINNQWKLIDTTWGAGYSRDSEHWVKDFDAYYFFTAPKDLLTTHYPEEKKWQLIQPTLNEKEFTSQAIYSSLFFENELKLLAPISGIIHSKNKAFILIEIDNLPPASEMGFAYENDYYLTSIIPEFEGSKAILKIPVTGKKNTTLNVLLETEMILQFRID